MDPADHDLALHCARQLSALCACLSDRRARGGCRGLEWLLLLDALCALEAHCDGLATELPPEPTPTPEN